MRKAIGSITAVVLFYAGTIGLANAQDLASVAEAHREGDMRALVVHDTPVALPDRSFTDPDGGEHFLSDYAGRIVVLNFWATWCGPCREEMPYLDALQRDYGGEDFAVVPLATGRNSVPGIRAFFADPEVAVTDLPILLDPQGQISRRAGVLGLPVTVLMDREGREIARLQGAADWAGPEARALIEALIAAEG